MNISKNGVNFIASHEEFRSSTYDDLQPSVKLTSKTKLKGVLTIGYGTTKYANGTKVKIGDTITKEKAQDLLKLQIEQHCSEFKKAIKIPLTQNQYDALASFSYNLGKYAIVKNNTMLNAINNRDWTAATNQMKLYNKAGGKVLAGLQKRRNQEVELFMKGLPSNKEVSKPPSNLKQVSTEKSITDVAKEVISGKWGNGDARKNALTKAGYSSNVIQTEVNRLLKGGK